MELVCMWREVYTVPDSIGLTLEGEGARVIKTRGRLEHLRKSDGYYL